MSNYINELLTMSKGVRRFIASESLLGISIGLFILVFNLHLLELGINEAQIGEITSIGTLVIGILAVPSGLLANRFGRKRLLVSGLFLMGIGYGGFGISEQYLTLLFFQIITSIGITLLITSEIQLLFYYSRSKKEETQAFSLLFAIFTLFTGVGTLLGGFLPKWIVTGNTTYQSSLFVSAVLLFLVTFIRGVLLPKEDMKLINRQTVFSLKKIIIQFNNKRLWILAFFTFIIGSAFAFVNPFQNIIVKFRLGWDDGMVSIFLTISGLFLFVGSIIMPYLLDRLGFRRTYLLTFVGNFLLSVILFFVLPVPLFAVLLLIRGGSFVMLNNLVDSQTMQATSEEDRNLFAGMRSVTRSLGSAIANFTAGIILAEKNYFLPFLISGLILLAGYLYFIFMVQPLLEEKQQNEAIIEISPV